VLVTITIVKNVQNLFDFLDSAVTTRPEVYLLNARGYQRQDGLGAMLADKKLVGRRGGYAWRSESIVGKESGACYFQE
jgi:hypothetical protein